MVRPLPRLARGTVPLGRRRRPAAPRLFVMLPPLAGVQTAVGTRMNKVSPMTSESIIWGARSAVTGATGIHTLDAMVLARGLSVRSQ